MGKKMNDFAKKIYLLHSEVLAQKILKLRKGKQLKVCFCVIAKQFWSMESIYTALQKYDLFKLYILPFSPEFQAGNEVKKNYEELCAFHREKGHPVIEVCDYHNNCLIPPEVIAPDIVFYEVHQQANFHPAYRIARLAKMALCIRIPYGVMIANSPETQFNSDLQNLAWKNFVESPIHLELSKKYADNEGANTVVSGYPKLDSYILPVKKNYWKTDNSQIKRIIWAPHYSINTGTKIDFGTFHLYVEQIFQLARLNQSKLELIVKPHPALKSHCIRCGFSERKYDAIMDKFNSLPNISIITDGDYLDLFKTSDAMILDSISFIAEYMICGKPMCFISKYKNYEELQKNFNEFGKQAIRHIDIAYNIQDIVKFVFKVCHDKFSVDMKRTAFVENLRVNWGESGKFIASHIVNELKKL